ncbi:glucose 1-dehydrogenase [Cytobacillus kochii]|uniref:SDR family NAD(P)-dependent oxidoreductase n=1 Tax=Cytobacillus kochii TaxID=859143 RepID=UPI002E1EE205|nr:glucose 1-dehydrogenase [Cytobacillus kochii]MED1607670.1 glucose 1-dehydrogenase [Cytobacillus kochii]
MKLKDKVAIITGAASGMGKAEALTFAREGAKIIVADINFSGAEEVAQLISAEGGRALAIQVDICQNSDIKQLVTHTLNQFGRIDILVNNAGIFDHYKTSLETNESEWDKIININLKGPYMATNAVLPTMLDRGEGTIINIASVAGLVAGKGGAAYTASKHAVIGYTKHLASAYASQGIRVNAICPGTIITPLVKDIINNIPVENIPAKRFGQQEEVAELAVFLASNQANFVHGAAIPIDGGFTIQ